MLKNFFLAGFRSLQRHKTYTLINVLGLGLSAACAVLIFSLVRYNLSFDRYHRNEDRIYRITTELSFEKKLYLPGVPSPLANAFANDYAFSEQVVKVFRSDNEQVTLPEGKADKKFEEKIAFTEPAFFEVFDFPLVQGDQSALSHPSSIFITESKAKTYFGEINPIGKTIRIANKADFTVAGILRDLPVNTDRREEIYLPFSALKTLQPWQVDDKNWLNVNSDMQCFVLLKQGISAARVNQVFPSFIHKYFPHEDAKNWKFVLQPLADIHLNTDLGALMGKESLIALSCIGLFLVLAACINFINLSTVQAIARSKEIGVRKVLGSSRRWLFWQFITETALIGITAVLLGFIVAEMALPYFNFLFRSEISVNLFTDIYLTGFAVFLLVFMVFSSSIYPGLVIAGTMPILALKSSLSHNTGSTIPLRKALVITQFAISQLLIIGTIVIVSQMRYSQRADMGFVKDGVVIIPIPNNQPSTLSSLKARLLAVPGVKDATFCYAPPADESASSGSITFGSRAVQEKFQISFRAGDENFAPFFNLRILSGRNVLPSDTVREFLINQSTVKMLGLKTNDDAIGQPAVINGYKGTIVGVVNDFHNKSFHAAIEPLAITTFFVWYERVALKINAANMKNTLNHLQDIWQQVFPNNLYKQEFFSERIATLYENDTRMMTLIQVFTIVSIFIGCISLYGLVSFMAAQKQREVAVRKVLGASIKSIVLLFSKEFFRLMIIAFLIAAPLGWYIMYNWLGNFAYRIDMSVWIFLSTLLITSGVVMLTIGYKSVKTALEDPSKSLRTN